MQSLPFSIDWRKRGVLNPIRNQLNCNCCWALVATTAIESLLVIKKKEKLIELSCQELIDCVEPKIGIIRKYGTEECRLGTINHAFRYIIKNGVGLDCDYPFEAKRGQCRLKNKNEKIIKISGYKNILENEISVMAAVVKQPVGAVIVAYEAFVKLKKGKLYEGVDEEEVEKLKFEKRHPGSHAVLIIGYGTDEFTNKNFWWIRNSWGTGWGEQGYCKVCRDSSLSPGRKSILTRFSVPIL